MTNRWRIWLVLAAAMGASVAGCAPGVSQDDVLGSASVEADGGLSDKASGCEGKCSASCPCEEGEGDCDRDADCAPGLVCPPDRPGAEQCEAAGSCEGRCSSDCPCGEGEGDCDRDSDCAPGLVCPPDGPGAEQCEASGGGSTNCEGRCSSDCPCGEGEGDCDRDADCLPGLVCPPDAPGAEQCEAAGGGSSSCEGQCSDKCPCGEGEGDCDRDSDCLPGLVCPPDAPGAEQCEAAGGGDSCEGKECSSDCPCGEGEGDCDRDSDCMPGLVCPPDAPGTEFCEAPGGGGGTGGGGDGNIEHIGTTEKWDGNGQNLTIDRPSGVREGDLLVLILHRTDDVLPLNVRGWNHAAACFKHDNGYDCATMSDCTDWYDSDREFCRRFNGDELGRDLAQTVLFKRASSNEPSRYSFDLNRDSSGHPGWAILTALRGANTSDPVRDWSHEGCDGSSDSLFPSVRGEAGDMLLLSQSFDDAISQSKFGAPSGTSTFGYVSNSDEAGFLFGGVLSSSGRTGTKRTKGDGGPGCKDGLVSMTIRPGR